MSGLANLVVKHKRRFLRCLLQQRRYAVLQSFVAVNYNMVDYLPPEAQSTKALEIMQEEFDADMPNASVMVKTFPSRKRLRINRSLRRFRGRQRTVARRCGRPQTTARDSGRRYGSGLLQERKRLYTVTIADGMEQGGLGCDPELIGEDARLAANHPTLQPCSRRQARRLERNGDPVAHHSLLSSILSSSSWIEPLLFYPDHWYIHSNQYGNQYFFRRSLLHDQLVSPILQLAVSWICYFLLHSFRQTGKNTVM